MLDEKTSIAMKNTIERYLRHRGDPDITELTLMLIEAQISNLLNAWSDSLMYKIGEDYKDTLLSGIFNLQMRLNGGHQPEVGPNNANNTVHR